jgi:hypothetical protein
MARSPSLSLSAPAGRSGRTATVPRPTDGRDEVSTTTPIKPLADQQDHRGRHRHVDQDQPEAEPIELDEVAEQEPGAEQHDPGLQPELVGGHPWAEHRGHADRVADEQSEDDCPEHELDVGQGGSGRLPERAQPVLGECADHTDGEEQQQSG